METAPSFKVVNDLFLDVLFAVDWAPAFPAFVLQVFFIRDGMNFPDMVHSLKPNPVTNLREVSGKHITNVLVVVYIGDNIFNTSRESRQ